MTTPRLVAIGVIAAAAWVPNAAARSDAGRPAVFTRVQADDGRALYRQRCSSCHMPDLSGSNDAPPLAGALFLSSWGARTTTDLIGYMSAAMPPGLGAA